MYQCLINKEIGFFITDKEFEGSMEEWEDNKNVFSKRLKTYLPPPSKNGLYGKALFCNNPLIEPRVILGIKEEFKTDQIPEDKRKMLENFFSYVPRPGFINFHKEIKKDWSEFIHIRIPRLFPGNDGDYETIWAECSLSDPAQLYQSNIKCDYTNEDVELAKKYMLLCTLDEALDNNLSFVLPWGMYYPSWHKKSC